MAETIIGLGAEHVKKDSTKEIAKLAKELAEKDAIIANADKTAIAKDEEISALKKEIAELKKGGSANGTTPENSGGGAGKSKAK